MYEIESARRATPHCRASCLATLTYHITGWDHPENLITKPWLLHDSVKGQSKSI